MLKNYGIIIILSLEFISGHFSKNVTVFTLKMAKNSDFGPFCNTPPNPPNRPKILIPLLRCKIDNIIDFYIYACCLSPEIFFVPDVCVSCYTGAQNLLLKISIFWRFGQICLMLLKCALWVYINKKFCLSLQYYIIRPLKLNFTSLPPLQRKKSIFKVWGCLIWHFLPPLIQKSYRDARNNF